MSITITARQLQEALQFAAGIEPVEIDPDESETEICIEELPEGTFINGEPRAAGLYCWLSEYPEEGCIPLFDVESADMGKTT